MSLVTAEGLSARLGGHLALSGVDMAIDRGEIVTIVGPNGSGKTTLLRAIIGAVAPAAGRIARAPGTAAGTAPAPLSLGAELKGLEAARIDKALSEAGGNCSRAARRLGMSRQGLWRKLNRRAP